MDNRANSSAPRVTELDIQLRANTLEERKLHGLVTLTFDRAGATQLDIGSLTIVSVSNHPELAGKITESSSGSERQLHVNAQKGSYKVTIAYETAVGTPGLEYLEPAATGSEYPLLFRKAHASPATSFVPCQDQTNATRVHLRLMVPKHLRGVATGIFDRRIVEDFHVVEHWYCPMALTHVAFAVGHLSPHNLRNGVRFWTLSHLIDSGIMELGEGPDLR